LIILFIKLKKLFSNKLILHNTNSEKLNRAYYNKQLEMARNLLSIKVFNELLVKLLFYKVELRAYVELYVNVELCGAAISNGLIMKNIRTF
jgi:hypothetical protein